MEDQRLHYLLLWNRVWCALLVIAVMVWGISSLFQHFNEDIRTLRVGWDGNDLRLSSATDGPFVVTHLVRYGATEADKAAAVLPESLAIVDSAGERIDAAAMKRLIWRSAINHDEVTPPRPGTPIRALYYRPSVAPSRTTATQ